MRHLTQAAVAGGVAGIPFALYASLTPNLDVLAWTFPVWQMLVGEWIYWNVRFPTIGKLD
jgi:hypothetical protein